jgi:hypothetical protein
VKVGGSGVNVGVGGSGVGVLVGVGVGVSVGVGVAVSVGVGVGVSVGVGVAVSVGVGIKVGVWPACCKPGASKARAVSVLAIKLRVGVNCSVSRPVPAASVAVPPGLMPWMPPSPGGSLFKANLMNRKTTSSKNGTAIA